jgi:hypothetical protein
MYGFEAILVLHWYFIPNDQLFPLSEPNKISIPSDAASGAFIYGQRDFYKPIREVVTDITAVSSPQR